MNLSRRNLLGGASMIALTRCATSGLTTSEAIAEIQAVVPAAEVAIADVAPGALSAAILSSVNTDFAAAGVAANSLSTSLAASDQSAGVAKFFASFNAGLAVLADPPVNGLLPAPLDAVIAAFSVLAPPIETLFTSATTTASATLAGAAATTKAKTVRGRAAAAHPEIKTRDDAMAVLAKYRRH